MFQSKQMKKGARNIYKKENIQNKIMEHAQPFHPRKVHTHDGLLAANFWTCFDEAERKKKITKQNEDLKLCVISQKCYTYEVNVAEVDDDHSQRGALSY